MSGIKAVIAVDVGGTHLEGAVLTRSGERLLRHTRPTPKRESVDAIADLVQSLKSAAGALGVQVHAVGIVTAGIVNESTGVVAFAANLGWRDLPLAALVQAHVNLPVFVGHDVRSAGLAEQALGAEPGVRDLFYVMIGTGVAAAVIAAGTPINGSGGAAGEFGHVPLRPDGEPCTCGQRGCLEVYVSGAGVARRYAARGGRALTTREIVGRLGHDHAAREVWDEGMRVLAQGLAMATLMVDPARIVIGGGFANAGEAMLVPLRRYLADALAWRPAPPVSVSRVGAEVGVIGAGMLAFTRMGITDVAAEWDVSR